MNRAAAVRSCQALPGPSVLSFWACALFCIKKLRKPPLSPLTPHSCLIKSPRASGRVVTCEDRMLRRDEGHCTGTGRSQESGRGSGLPPVHRDVGAECNEGRPVPPVSGLSSLPVLQLTLAIRMEILEWQNPSSFGVAAAMTPLDSIA